MVVIEHATREDQLQSVASLMRDFSNWAIATFHADDDLPPNVFEKLEAELAHLPGRFSPPKGTLLLATDHEGRAHGCIGGAPLDSKRIEASRLWVAPMARGKDVGRRLVTELIRHARAQSVETIVLRSHAHMDAAHRLYSAAGFSKEDAGRHFDNLQQFEIAMVLPLNIEA